jgi:flagellar hook-associated protein 1 FlgK
MGISPVFDLAARALLAQQAVLNTAGHNLANVNRPSYSRQEVVLVNDQPQRLSGIVLGGGVGVDSLRQVVDPVVEAQLVRARSAGAEAGAAGEGLSRLEGIFRDLEGSGLQDALDAFLAGADDLAIHPQGIPERIIFLARAESLAEYFRGTARRLAELQGQIDDRVSTTVPQINGLLDDIARLNGLIFAEEIGGQKANDFRDQRREALNELSELVGIKHFESDVGVTVLGPGSLLLVDGERVTHLVTDTSTAPTIDGLDGRPLSQIGFQVANGDFVPLTSLVDGGELGGLLAVRDTDLPSVAADVDRLAEALRTAVNAVHTNGEDLDGNVGGALFSGTGAADLTVLITDPRQVAASAITGVAPATPEDNRNALALAAIGFAALDGTDPALGNADLGGATPAGFFASLVAAVGWLTETATDRAEVAQALTTELENRRAAVSGVSTDEELLTLLEAQRAFQAAATLVSVATSTVDAVLEMVR